MKATNCETKIDKATNLGVTRFRIFGYQYSFDRGWQKDFRVHLCEYSVQVFQRAYDLAQPRLHATIYAPGEFIQQPEANSSTASPPDVQK